MTKLTPKQILEAAFELLRGPDGHTLRDIYGHPVGLEAAVLAVVYGGVDEDGIKVGGTDV